MADTFFKRMLSNSLWHILGRRNLVRLGRFLDNEGRLDTGNNPASNGQSLVLNCLHRLPPASEKQIILDIGANVGEWSRALLMESQSPHSSFLVHAFEPCEETYRTLLNNLNKWGLVDRVQTHQLAFSDNAGQKSFFSLGANQGRNSLYAHQGEAYVVQQVSCRTLDDWCLEQGIETVFFAKIDTEGHDFEVLRGAQNMLTNGRIEMAQFEYNHRWITARRFLLDAFEFLLPLGYSIGKITSKGIEFYEGWHHELETFREGNYLVVKPEYRASFPFVNWWNVRK